MEKSNENNILSKNKLDDLDQNIIDLYKKELSTLVINNNSLYTPLSSCKNGDALQFLLDIL